MGFCPEEPTFLSPWGLGLKLWGFARFGLLLYLTATPGCLARGFET